MTLRNKLRTVGVTLAAVGAIVALGASSASAAEVEAKYSAGTIKLSGNVTLKKNGAEATGCELKEAKGSTSGGAAFIYNNFLFETEFTCPGKPKFTMKLAPTAAYYNSVTGAYSFKIETPAGESNEGKSPWGNYYYSFYGSPVGAWTNGSGATQSTITFNEANFGALTSFGLAKITVSGTLTATTSTGGLLTLSH